MAIITSTQSGLWSATSTWDGGALPADGDEVVIFAGHTVTMDTDTSSFTGLGNVTIQGHATTPATLECHNGYDGWLSLQTGSILQGTSATEKGRLVCNSDGTFTGTTALQQSNKFMIDMHGTAYINATYLDIRFYCNTPSVDYVEIYEKSAVVTADDATDTFNATAHSFVTDDLVVFRSTGGVPAPLYQDILYYVVSAVTDSFKVALTAGGTAIDLEDSGSGTITAFVCSTDAPNTPTVNVIQDVTTEDCWETTEDYNIAVLVDLQSDRQRQKITAITANTITLDANVNSAQRPLARLYTCNRNITIRSDHTSTVVYQLMYSNNNVVKCNITNNQVTTTPDTYAIGNCYDNEFNIISHVYTGVNVSDRNIIDLIIGIYQYGISGTAHYNTIREIAGCAYGIGGDWCEADTIYGCGSALTYTKYSKVTNAIACDSAIISNVSSGSNIAENAINCNYGIYNSGFTSIGMDSISGQILGTKNLVSFAVDQWEAIFRKGLIVDRFTFYYRNSASYKRGKLRVEGGGMLQEGVYYSAANVLRTPCNGSGAAPSEDPDGGTGDCIGVEALSTIEFLNLTKVFEDHKIWFEAGTHTITYKIQTTHTNLVADDLVLSCWYYGTDGIWSEEQDTTAVSTRSGTTDWTETKSVTITTTIDGFVELDLQINKYESGKYIYVWPTPVIS